MKKIYGKEVNVGDIIFNGKNKSVFTTLDFGFGGKTTLNLVINKEEGGYDLFKSYTDKDGQLKAFKAGRLFPAKNFKTGELIEGIAKGSFGLSSLYDKEKGKTVFNMDNGVVLTSHKLKSIVDLGNGFKKVGYLTGQFFVSVEDTSTPAENPTVEAPAQVEGDDEPIPF
jgi:hypothetical protein